MTKRKDDTLTPKEKWRLIVQGGIDTFPLVLGATPFGLIYGALVIKSGLSLHAGMAMSTFVFAGSAQFIAVGLAAAGISWPFIVLTTFVVNLRHALYSATLAPCLSPLKRRWKIPLAFWLTDETFAASSAYYFKRGNTPGYKWHYLGSALYMYINWQLCTLIGLFAGSRIPDATDWGLDAAMPITFIGIVVPYLKNSPMILCAAVSAVISACTWQLPNKTGLIIAAVAGIAAGVIAEKLKEKGEKKHE